MKSVQSWSIREFFKHIFLEVFENNYTPLEVDDDPQ